MSWHKICCFKTQITKNALGITLKNFVLDFKKALSINEKKVFSREGASTSDIIDLALKFDALSRQRLQIETHLDLKHCFSSLTTILAFWAHSNARVDPEQLRHLTEIKPVLVRMYLTGFDPKQEILLRGYDKKNDYKQNLTKILLLLSINNISKDLYRAFLSLETETAYYFASAWLMERCQMTLNARVYHQKLIDNFHKYKEVRIEPNYFEDISVAYMFTSYSNSTGKDEIKGTISDQIANTIYRYNKKDNVSTSRKTIRNTPTILIIHEKFSNTHVMMRCFLRPLEYLKKKFEIVHLAAGSDAYDQLEKDCSKIVSANHNFRTAIDYIRDIDPDVILYPSLGMHPLPIMLSTLRLAPIQLQLFGHPSSSHSREIDGSLITSTKFHTTGPEKCTQTAPFMGGIDIEYNSLNFEYCIPNRPASDLNDKLNVAINGKSMKLSPRFIEFLSTINWPENVQLNFFPGERGIHHAIVENFIKKYFRNAKVYSLTDYADYMKNLAIQDCAICPFPFGNTNGIIDSMKIGLPTFVLKGEELCSMPEYELLNFFCLEEFVSNTQEEMAESIVNFLSNKTLRQSLSEKFQKNASFYLTNNDVSKAQKIRGETWSQWITCHILDYNS